MEAGTVRATMYRGRGRTSVGEGRKLPQKGGGGEEKSGVASDSVGCSGRREKKLVSSAVASSSFSPILVVFLEILLLEGPPYLPTT